MIPPWMLDHAPYTPFVDARTARAPGLCPLDMAEWTVRDPDFDGQMVRRAEIMAAHTNTVLASTNGGEPAALELLSMLKAHLGLDPAITHLEEFCPLTAMAHMVAEDFCVLLPDPESSEYRLVAAILCFPSRWLLSEKMGRPLTIIHDPVPEYDDGLARRVNRVFEALRPERPLFRCNWLLHTDPELFLPIGRETKRAHRTRGDGPLYLRTERQTLVRLPRTGAVAFGIKTSITPIACLEPPVLHGLASAFADRVEENTADGDSAADRRATLARLEELAGQAA